MTARRQNLDYQMAGNASLGHEICVRRALDESNMLLDLWRGSVAATHAFLAPDEVEDLVPEVLSALEVLDIWVAEIPSAASNDGKETSAVGFVGLLGSRVEALFVASDCFGRGIGTALLNHARTLIKADILVDCNEENPKALEFYQRRGFLVTGRSPGDSRGRPHPLVHLRLPGTDSEDDLIFPNELFIQIMDRLSTLGHLRSLVTTISASRRFYQLGLPVLYRSITLSEAIHGSFNPNKSTLFPPFVLNIDPLSQIRNLNVALMNPIPDPVSLFSRILPSSRSITLSTESSSILQPLWHALYLNQCPFLETMNLRHSGKTPDVLAMFPIPHFPAIPTSVRKVRITVPSTGPIKRLFLLVDRAENVESCHLAGAVHRADAERLEQFHPGLWSRLTSLEANEKEVRSFTIVFVMNMAF
jgi:putative acetyltransferase